jgi:hypothetical protein
VNELRGLNTASGGSPAENDIVSLGGSGLTYRAARGIGFLCQSTAAGQLRIARGSYSGYRDPEAGRDVAYLLVESTTDSTASWVPLIINRATRGSGCSGADGSIDLSTASAGGSVEAPAGTPVRVYEVMELKTYQSDGQWWLGARSVSGGEVIQPVAGPLADRDGFHLEFLTPAGVPTASPDAVGSIRITVRVSGGEVRRAGNVEAADEELTTQVALRNVTLR